MKNKFSINYFENEKYRIKKVKDGFEDKFEINEVNNVIIVKRIDANEGWGANLRFKVFNKVTNKEGIEIIGKSDHNIKRKKLQAIISKDHYENDKYKLYIISNYNDLFKINYNEKNNKLKITRTDKSLGWKQDLKMEYYDKATTKIKHISIGPNKSHIKELTIDLESIKYMNEPNYYEDENSIVKIKKNIHKDEFEFSYEAITNILKIKRVDSDEGWGQYLMLKIRNKKNNRDYIFYIGSSHYQVMLKKLNFQIPKIYVSLTTIPSRIKILTKNLQYFIENQSQEIDKIYVNIPIKYKRFKENINQENINELMKINKVEIIILEKDYGPSSKYLGPLMKYKRELENNLLIIIDDDRIYNKHLVRNFVIAYHSLPQYEFYAGLWKYFFDDYYKKLSNEYLEITKYKEINKDKFHYGNGLGGFFGFCLKLKNSEEFVNYHLKILDKYEKSFFHDEGISLGYLKKKEIEIIYLKHIGCYSYEKESVDALCLSGKCNRKKVEKDILYITNNENLL